MQLAAQEMTMPTGFHRASADVVHVLRAWMIVAALVAAGGPWTALAQADSGSIRAVLEERDLEIKRILGDRDEISGQAREDLKAVINEMIDFEAMSKYALGRYWEELTDEERARFVVLFGGVVKAQSLSNLDVYRSTVTYDEIEVDGETALVRTTTVYDDVPMNVAYWMRLRAGRWFIEDIELDEVSTADGYRRSFRSIIRKRGYDTLVERLENRLEREGAPTDEEDTAG